MGILLTCIQHRPCPQGSSFLSSSLIFSCSAIYRALENPLHQVGGQTIFSSQISRISTKSLICVARRPLQDAKAERKDHFVRALIRELEQPTSQAKSSRVFSSRSSCGYPTANSKLFLPHDDAVKNCLAEIWLGARLEPSVDIYPSPRRTPPCCELRRNSRMSSPSAPHILEYISF